MVVCRGEWNIGLTKWGLFWRPEDSAEESGLPALIMGSKHRFLGGESARIWPKYRTSVSDVRLCC